MFTDISTPAVLPSGAAVSRLSSVDYVFSACRYAGRGLAALLAVRGRRCLQLSPENGGLLMADMLRQAGQNSRVVVYFPDTPAEMLLTIEALTLLCRMHPWPPDVLLLCNARSDWMYLTLRRLAGGDEPLSAMRMTRADTPLHKLALWVKDWRSQPLLVTSSREETARDGIKPEGMTSRELDVVLSMLLGDSITNQGQRLGLSRKTLYIHRISGLCKLTGLFPGLTFLLPRSQRPVQTEDVGERVSAFEQAFEQDIHLGRVFPVFQPVTDAAMRVKGFEILIRWRRDGRELLPGEFLPEMNAFRLWLLLTARVISEAVQQINRTRGACYFAVNVPVSVAESGALIRMMQTARAQLTDRQLADRLVLEFSEETDVRRGQVRESIICAQEAGHRVLLDDCFSEASVLFPVRQVQFSGYKLDMSIVNSFQQNSHNASLVASLAGYCRLNGVECIAEGVESRETFTALIRAGVTGFQGFYISRPVYREQLDETVRQVQARGQRKRR